MPTPGQAMGDPRRFNVHSWLLWTVGFVSFPLAGVAALAASAGSMMASQPWSAG
jgi:hypothetical protein